VESLLTRLSSELFPNVAMVANETDIRVLKPGRF